MSQLSNSKRVAINTEAMEWQASPSPGVWRKRLELIGEAESGRVTSVVRYAPGSAFSSHEHPQGEEILVLAGTFSDQSGSYPAGSYLLNPEGFSHAPFSQEGCTLFVKLRQYGGANRKQVRLLTRDLPWLESSRGIEVKWLYAQAGFPEKIRLERWKPGVSVNSLGREIFVLSGVLADEEGEYRSGTWLRYPAGTALSPQGCVLYMRQSQADTTYN